MEKHCTYCMQKAKVFPLSRWNNRENVRYYCEDCLAVIQKTEEKEKQRFIKYYSNPMRYSWLPEKSKELYKELLK